ncbi:1-deoxy-D-xylulose-5-phosphate synthase [uncultured archaeon]|nr:1-deoxy-D-xylulose-5-phosphate synthase [uncultured archaeon]
MQQIARNIRKDVIRTIEIKGGHPAVNLSSADILTALYFKILKHNPRQPKWEERDRIFVTSKLTPVWQTTLAHAGYYAKKNLLENADLPKGTTHALSTAIGSALASEGKHHTYCITTDSEIDWQAIMLAGKLNLTLVIDRNNLSKEGFMDIEPLRQKLEAFNWHIIEVDGHKIEHIIEALQEAKDGPTAIICHTIPGKGVNFMEHNPEWHDKKPTKEEAEKALNEIK